MLIAGRFRYVVLSGSMMYRSQGAVESFSFQADLEDDDLPPDES